jgi:hypothetical protein
MKNTTEFTLHELDEIHTIFKLCLQDTKFRKLNKEQLDLHKSIIQKVNAMTAEILEKPW